MWGFISAHYEFDENYKENDKALNHEDLTDGVS